MTSEEIVKALREDCKTCSESLICENGTNLAGLYCANKDAADLIERMTADVADLRKELEWKDMVISLAQRKQAEAEAERDALREKQRWIPVTERLPEIYDKDPDWSKTVLFRTVFGHIHSGYRNIGRPQTSVYDDDWTPPYWIDESENLHFEEDEVTHWMPLPEPPKETGV